MKIYCSEFGRQARTIMIFVILICVGIFSKLSYAEQSLLTLQNGEWHQLAVPLNSLIHTPRTIAGTSLDYDEYKLTWTIFGYAEGEYYEPALEDPLQPGTAVWMIQLSGQDVVLEVDIGSEALGTNVDEKCSSE